MPLVKVSNVRQSNGTFDYKGLDRSKIVGGSQVYPSYDNVAYFQYDGEVVEGADIKLVTQATYDEHKQRVAEELANIITPEKKIEQLEQQVLSQQSAINMLLGV
jgi:hypothetical protein